MGELMTRFVRTRAKSRSMLDQENVGFVFIDANMQERLIGEFVFLNTDMQVRSDVQKILPSLMRGVCAARLSK